MVDMIFVFLPLMLRGQLAKRAPEILHATLLCPFYQAADRFVEVIFAEGSPSQAKRLVSILAALYSTMRRAFRGMIRCSWERFSASICLNMRFSLRRLFC